MVFVGFTVITIDKVVLLLALLTSGFLLAQRKIWGCVFGFVPAAIFAYMSTRYTGYMIKIELLVAIALAVFYTVCGIAIYKKRLK